MITEDYISFPNAKLLKEKGWNQSTKLSFLVNEKTFGVKEYDQEVAPYFSEGCDRYWRPTQALVVKWLRIKHKIDIGVYVSQDGKWGADITVDWTKTHKGSGNFNYFDNSFKLCYKNDWKNYDTPEQALEAAISYSLLNLVK